MALATRCPSCQARFRVAPDQLKLRGGLVRCGACRHVFDAIGTLNYVDDAVLGTAPASAQPAVDAVIAAIRKAESTVGEAIAADSGPTAEAPPERTDRAGAASAAQSEPGHPAEATSVPDATVGAAAAAAGPAASGTEPIPRAAQAVHEAVAEGNDRHDDVERHDGLPPAATPVASGGATEQAAVEHESFDGVALAAEPAPSFLREAPAPKKRGRRLLLGMTVALLAALAAAQLAVVFRAEIVAGVPSARPALGQLCRLFRCTVDWPARPEALAVVGSELQALPGTAAFELTALVRNRGQATVALPAIELTLTDTLNRTVARRIFTPADYLAGHGDAASQIAAGLAAGADLSIHLGFEARGINAAGFVVYPFYL